MERRDQAPGGLENTATTKAWQAVRRALGRLVSHVGVRTVADPERTIPAAVLGADLALPKPGMSSGSAWKPSAAVRRVSAPQADTGMRESDLLPTVSLAHGDHAMGPPDLRAMPTADGDPTGVEQVTLDWPVGVVHLPDSFLRLPVSPIRIGATGLLPLPKTAQLQAGPLKKPPVALLKLPRFPDPRVHWGGDSVLRRMPLTRRGKAAPANLPAADVFLAERRRLAETMHLPADEIMLLGVYPDVPIMAVERVLVEDEGRQLKLWLKPDALRGKAAPHRITLLIGRQIATGKMLQAAL